MILTLASSDSSTLTVDSNNSTRSSGNSHRNTHRNNHTQSSPERKCRQQQQSQLLTESPQGIKSPNKKDRLRGGSNNNASSGTKPRKSSSLTPVTLESIDLKTIGPYVALDCEMVGVGAGGVESAIARVSLVKWSKEEVLLDTFVRMPHDVQVTDYRTFVSGVTPKDLMSPSAMTFEACRDLVKYILKGRVLVGHALDNDLQALCIDHPDHDKRDTATYVPFMQLGTGPVFANNVGASNTKNGAPPLVMCPRKLKDLCKEKLGLEIQSEGKPHSSVEDARAALRLYRKVRDEWEILMCWQKKKAACPGMVTDYNSPARSRAHTHTHTQAPHSPSNHRHNRHSHSPNHNHRSPRHSGQVHSQTQSLPGHYDYTNHHKYVHTPQAHGPVHGQAYPFPNYTQGQGQHLDYDGSASSPRSVAKCFLWPSMSTTNLNHSRVLPSAPL